MRLGNPKFDWLVPPLFEAIGFVLAHSTLVLTDKKDLGQRRSRDMASCQGPSLSFGPPAKMSLLVLPFRQHQSTLYSSLTSSFLLLISYHAAHEFEKSLS